MEEYKNYYEILGLKPGASIREIEIAFKKMVIKFHPDKFKKDGEEAYKKAVERFSLINEAYHVLSNPEKRKKYDEMLKTGSFIPPQIKARKTQAKNAFKMGKECFDRGEYAKSSMYFKSALTLDPSFIEARIYLALSYVRSGRKKEEILNLLNKLEPKIETLNNPEVIYLIARAFLGAGEKKKAVSVLEKGLKIFKNNEKLNKLYKEIGGKKLFKIFPFK